MISHAMKNALIPVVTVVGLQLPILISGSVVVESIYNVPGMGQQFFLSIGTRDYTVGAGDRADRRRRRRPVEPRSWTSPTPISTHESGTADGHDTRHLAARRSSPT